MKLIDFTNDANLNALREEMGAEFVEWNVETWTPKSADSVRAQLGTRKGIELDEDLEGLEIEDDETFSYKGEKVLLYIRDQYYSDDPNREYKYHICSCRTIDSMFEQGRKNRYVVTKNTSETFYVRLLENNVVVEEGPREMRVCKSCLQELSYKGYGHHASSRSKQVYREFALDEFFDLYGESRFAEKPDYDEYGAPKNKYPDNFDEISKRYRKKQDWVCEKCGLDLSSDRQWLHTHHIDHQKYNNGHQNLKALCLDCHAEIHPQLRSNSEYRKFIATYGSSTRRTQ
jgi:hypothetical protein